jgi:hypothetical protein
MVLESLVSLKEGIRNPWKVFYLSSVVSLVSFVISFIIFKQDVGLYAVILTTLGLTPFMTKLNIYEAKKSEVKRSMGIENMLFYYAKDKSSILKLAIISFLPFLIAAFILNNLQSLIILISLYIGIFLIFSLIFFSIYKEIIISFAAIFAGMVLTFSILYLLLPAEIAEKTFKTQIEEIKAIRGYFSFGGTFQTIFINNVGVLFLSFVFSFIYGSGAILILSWNASILATAASMMTKSLGGSYTLPIALASYLPHGSLEIVAYFLAAMAGGIISYHLMKEKEIKTVLEDCLFLLSLGVLFVLLGAIVETAAILG